MGLFGKLLETGIDLATSPIEVIKDVATLGGAITEQETPYTLQRLEKLADDAEEVVDEIAEL